MSDTRPSETDTDDDDQTFMFSRTRMYGGGPGPNVSSEGEKEATEVEDHLIYKFIIIYIILFIRKGDLNLNYQVSQSRTKTSAPALMSAARHRLEHSLGADPETLSRRVSSRRRKKNIWKVEKFLFHTIQVIFCVKFHDRYIWN